MELSDGQRENIADEFTSVAKLMRSAPDSSAQNFFFSAAYGAAMRVLNMEFDPNLVLIHDILLQTHQRIDVALLRIISGQERIIKVPQQLFGSLAQAVGELGDAIRSNSDFIQPLQKIAVLGYAMTGNGYYLLQKGALKL